MAAKSKGQSFEDQLTGLEEIVGDLESGDLSLEESLKRFEEGVKLYKNCKKDLSAVEKKIAKLTDDLKEEEL